MDLFALLWKGVLYYGRVYVSTSWNRNLTSYNHILCFFDKCDCLVIKVICL